MSRRQNLGILLLAAVALVGARQALRTVRHNGGAPGAGAEWIWAESRGEPGTATAFFAVKDFELPFRATEGELRILADEEYQLALNGRRFAVGRYREGAGLDAYPLAPVLRRGKNRIAVELRSARGAGGLLVRLEAKTKDGEAAVIVSDGSWSILRRFDDFDRFRQRTRPVAEARDREDPVVWGSQPAGRWGLDSTVHEALTLRQLQASLRRKVQPALRSRGFRESWHRGEHDGNPALGPWASFDFGGEVTGFLRLTFAGASAETGFVYYDLKLPKDGLAGHDEVIVRPRGSESWMAASPARFRYLTIVGAPQISSAEVLLVDEELAAALLERPSRQSLFGIERVRTLVPPMEDEVRSKLESIPGFARREES